MTSSVALPQPAAPAQSCIVAMSTTKLMTHPSEYIKKSPTKETFIGPYQPSLTRLPGKPPVDYEHGGCDFRSFQPSSLGRQLQSHRASAGYVPIASAPRFGKSDTFGAGPCFLAPMTSLKRQNLSNRRSAPNVHFGTSTRAQALKTYAVFTYKK